MHRWPLILFLFSAFLFGRTDAKRKPIKVALEEVAGGVEFPTDIQFLPVDADKMIVLQKKGTAVWISLRDPQKRGEIMRLKVLDSSELGLLGLAFHPAFLKNRRIYVNYNPDDGKPRRTVVSEWTLDSALKATGERVLLEVAQPYSNHNAGQLLFGKDGYLYVGMGDGGYRDDPHGNGQNPKALLGKMLRVDVNAKSSDKPYGIPADNPFVHDNRFAPEIWALGLRNPWRYSWDPNDRLIVADVGQNRWEEVSIVERGGNYGWNTREAAHCFKPQRNCKTEGFKDPWLEYDREDGASVTGGYVYQGKRLKALQGKYVFGDFVSGRLWAADLPPKGQENRTHSIVYTLGRWPVNPSTFGRDPEGEIYLGDYTSGKIYRLVP